MFSSHGYLSAFQFLNSSSLGLLYVLEIGGAWNLVAEFSINISLFLLLAEWGWHFQFNDVVQISVNGFIGINCVIMGEHGKPLWSRLILQVTGIHEACTARELFDRLHLSSRCSFSDSLILQLGGGSRKSLKVVVVKKYGGESQILSRRLTCKFVLLSLSASKLCHESLQQGMKLCLLDLGLCSIASGVVLTWFFTGIPEEPSSTIFGSNDGCSGWDELLVEGVEIKEILVVVDGSKGNTQLATATEFFWVKLLGIADLFYQLKRDCIGVELYERRLEIKVLHAGIINFHIVLNFDNTNCKVREPGVVQEDLTTTCQRTKPVVCTVKPVHFMSVQLDFRQSKARVDKQKGVEVLHEKGDEPTTFIVLISKEGAEIKKYCSNVSSFHFSVYGVFFGNPDWFNPAYGVCELFKSILTRLLTIWLVVELPGSPGYLSSCRVLFDRGKVLKPKNSGMGTCVGIFVEDLFTIHLWVPVMAPVLFVNMVESVVLKLGNHVLHIFFMEFKFLSVLPFSAHTVAGAKLYLSRLVNLNGNHTLVNACRCLPCCSRSLGFIFRHKWRSKKVFSVRG
ncbi:hypothetical protein C5167_002946 [Papaver somniferum]|uniref:Uncharacterized protein n=1 Tax=Papaver somniferum TaxID=3469 RepID=A0A4Y7L288_PAPSO|nr:hypothetical protein C5167_002946 [Papaver somniferum]